MATGKDYYSVLGVSPTADAGVVKAAYRALGSCTTPTRSTPP
jgi:curved DNA-binding protein CbpA